MASKSDETADESDTILVHHVNKMNRNGSNGKIVTTEAEKYAKDFSDKHARVARSCAVEKVLCKEEQLRKKYKQKERNGRRLKISPKMSLMPVNCCFRSNTMSMDESSEENDYITIKKTAGPTLVCIENSSPEDPKLECFPNTPKFHNLPCDEIANCNRCNRKGLEFDLLKIERSNNKLYEHSKNFTQISHFPYSTFHVDLVPTWLFWLR